MSLSSKGCAWGAALGWLLLASAARAEPSASDLNTARRLFQEATALEQRSDWRSASAKLDGALAIKETPGLHFHRAHCAEQLGELVLAARHYGRAEELIRAGAAAPDVEELLTAARARVLSRVPRLTLSLPSDVAGATLEIDGSPVSESPGTPVILDPGRHRIVARAPGRRDFEMEITLIEGQTQTLEVALARPPEPIPAPLPAEPAKGAAERSGFGTREVVLVAETTLVVAGLGAGVGFSIARGSASNRIDQAQQSIDAETGSGETGCSGAGVPAACAELDAALSDHEQASRFATIGFVTAGVGAAAAALTWMLWPSDGTPTNASVAPVAGGATLLVRGAF